MSKDKRLIRFSRIRCTISGTDVIVTGHGVVLGSYVSNRSKCSRMATYPSQNFLCVVVTLSGHVQTEIDGVDVVRGICQVENSIAS